MRIVIAGETYAENLGDGVIAKTLSYLVGRACPDADLTTLDISGRTGWKSAVSIAPSSELKRSSLASRLLPLQLRCLLRWYVLGQRKTRKQYFRASLREADLLLVGGGQLIMDSKLQFPLSLELLAAEARTLKIPVWIICCGVGSDWSRLGRFLVSKVLKQADKIVVRDSDSSKRLAADFGFKSADVLIDPALWSKDVFAGNQSDITRCGCLGLGIIAAEALDEHLRRSRGPVEKAEIIERWIEFIDVARGHYSAIELFTNGHPDDFELARIIAAEAKLRLNYDCLVAVQPRLPEQLVHGISGYCAVVAYRLHACIIAASFGLPVVGIGWDQKVSSFFRDLGQEWRCFAFDDAIPASVLEALGKIDIQMDSAALIEAKKALLLKWFCENLNR